MSLLAVAAGGGGVGRHDIPADYDYKIYLKNHSDCAPGKCEERLVRPGELSIDWVNSDA